MSAALKIPTPPQALTLVLKGTEDPIAYACPVCGILWTPASLGPDSGAKAHEIAMKGAANHCHNYCECGNPTDKGWTICRSCRDVREKEREAKKYALAKKIPQEAEEGEPVYWEGHSGSMGDGFFSGVDEVIDYCEEEGVPLPAYVWTCSPTDFTIDVDSFLEHAFQEHHEDARDRLKAKAEEELGAFLTKWCSEQNIKTWNPDFRRAIVLDPA